LNSTQDDPVYRQEL
jgi:hypothetical protein